MRQVLLFLALTVLFFPSAPLFAETFTNEDLERYRRGGGVSQPAEPPASQPGQPSKKGRRLGKCQVRDSEIDVSLGSVKESANNRYHAKASVRNNSSCVVTGIRLRLEKIVEGKPSDEFEHYISEELQPGQGDDFNIDFYASGYYSYKLPDGSVSLRFKGIEKIWSSHPQE